MRTCAWEKFAVKCGMADLLTQDAVAKRLSELSGWGQEEKELVKEFRFGDYLCGIEFVRQVGEAAEAMDHHPDMLVKWRRVELRLSTHSAGGLTELDFALAGKAEEIFADLG